MMLSMSISKSTRAENIHPEVQAALDWELPANECEPPKVKASHVTSHSERKYKKAKKKFEKCYNNYKSELVKQQQEMMAVAKHGLTTAQAETIMKNMKQIQVIATSDYKQATVLVTEMPHQDMEIRATHH